VQRDAARDGAGILKASGLGTGAAGAESTVAEEDKEKGEWLSLTTFLSHLAKQKNWLSLHPPHN
jgi:hypothetical protein